MHCFFLKAFVFCTIFLCIALAYPVNKSPQSPIKNDLNRLPIITANINGHRIPTWLLTSYAQYGIGLKNVTQEELSGKAMLFSYPTDVPAQYTMKDTLTSIDIVFLDKNGVVLKTLSMKAGCDQLYNPKISFRFALELPANAIQQYNIQQGNKLTFSNIPSSQ